MAGYGTDVAFAAWLADQGLTLPAGAPTPAVLRQRGSDYIDGLYSGVGNATTGQVFSGTPTGGVTQERAWPRTGATYAGQAIASDLIPDAVIRASYNAAYAEAKSQGSLSVTLKSAQTAKRKKVGSVEIEYSEKSDATAGDMMAPVLTAVYGLLKPFLIDQRSSQLGVWSVGRG